MICIRQCKHCNKDKEESEFSFFRNKRNTTCKECRNRNNKWYAEDKGERKTKAKLYYKRIKHKIAQYRSDLRLDRKYKLTREKWNEMLEKQNNKCGICKVVFGEYKPCVDHNHQNGKVRGLLCRKCNLKLEVIEDTNFCKNAQSYLDSMK